MRTNHERVRMTAAGTEERALRVGQEPMKSTGERRGFLSGTFGSLADIWRRRELLWLLTRREVTARYKDSSLGVVWSLFRPLAQLLIYYFAIGVILGVARSVPDFAIFVFVGLTMWGLFAEILSLSTTSIVNNSGIVKKVYLPREVFPLSAVGSALFNFGVQLVILVVATIVLGAAPLSGDLVYAPLAFLVILVFGTAIGLILAALNVYFRDVQHIIEVVLIILFWASPIVYSYTFVHAELAGSWLETLYLSNPVTIAIIGMQKAFWVAGTTSTGDLAQVFPENLLMLLLVALGASLLLLWLAQRVFSRLQRNFAQEL
jgi:ABC-2 type transport system permease protein